MSHTGYLEAIGFFGSTDAVSLAQEFGTPLYVYNEAVLRHRCREIAGLLDYPGFAVNYAAKANSNPALLGIVREEGLSADAISPAEIALLQAAGYPPEQIVFTSNNVSTGELRFALEQGVTVSVDSLSQLDAFGRLNPGGRVWVRFNPGIGAGHHQKVRTAGAGTKFGVADTEIAEVKAVLRRHRLRLTGVNMHIGSLFLDPGPYVQAAELLMTIAEQFDEVEAIDFGGGFGIPYRKHEGQERLDLRATGELLGGAIDRWCAKTGWNGRILVEPGRYVSAECGILLGTVHAVKESYGTRYVGTDLGFNVLARPILYDAHHDLEVFSRNGTEAGPVKEATVVGNICESGDVLAGNRVLPDAREGDVLAILDAGAYGYAMSSNYNMRLRPAEVLLRDDGEARLIRRRETLDDLLRTLEPAAGEGVATAGTVALPN
jgi:diaminopimelate decarboxylase